MEKEKITNGQYYVSELKQLKEAIKSKYWGKLRAGVHLLQDNAPIHTGSVAVVKAANCGFKFLTHPYDSAELAQSELHPVS